MLLLLCTHLLILVVFVENLWAFMPVHEYLNIRISLCVSYVSVCGWSLAAFRLQ